MIKKGCLKLRNRWQRSEKILHKFSFDMNKCESCPLIFVLTARNDGATFGQSLRKSQHFKVHFTFPLGYMILKVDFKPLLFDAKRFRLILIDQILSNMPKNIQVNGCKLIIDTTYFIFIPYNRGWI